MQRTLPEIENLGATLVAISPQLPDKSLSTKVKLGLRFEVISDVGNKVARKFGLVFTMPVELISIYRQFGMEVNVANGDESWQLPAPATFVIEQDSTIIYAFVDIDYTKRAEPDDIVKVLRERR